MVEKFPHPAHHLPLGWGQAGKGDVSHSHFQCSPHSGATLSSPAIDRLHRLLPSMVQGHRLPGLGLTIYKNSMSWRFFWHVLFLTSLSYVMWNHFVIWDLPSACWKMAIRHNLLFSVSEWPQQNALKYNCRDFLLLQWRFSTIVLN